jgi:hypothetical protein
MTGEEGIPFPIVKIHDGLDKNMTALTIHRPCDIHILELLLILLVHCFQIRTCRLLDEWILLRSK